MPPILLGDERLRLLLDGGGQVILANRADAVGETRIVSAAIVRHYDDGAMDNLAAFDLDIGPDESVTFDQDRPREFSVVAVEVVLRVITDRGECVAEAYAVSQTLDVRGLRLAEFGVVDRQAELGEGESAIPDAPSIAIYAKPA